MLYTIIVIVVWSVIALLIFDLKKIGAWQEKVRAQWEKLKNKANN